MRISKTAVRAATLLSIALFTALNCGGPAHAAVIFGLLYDPVSTAGPGSTSNRSGRGTWQVYAVDDYPVSATNAGIASFSFSLGTTSGTITASNRSPTANYDSDGGGTNVVTGFSLARQALGNNTNSVTVTGAQNPAPDADASDNKGVDYYPISGLGQEASSFTSKYPKAVVSPTSGSWGNYSVLSNGFSFYSDTDRNGHKWLFLAEGTYSGSRPSLTAASALVYSNFTNTFLPTMASVTTEIGYINLPPNVASTVIENVNANAPGSVAHTFFSYEQANSWGTLLFVSGPTPAIPPTLDPATHRFSWNTIGSPIGSYKWSLQATNAYGTSTGFLTVNITVPEPATFSLAGLSLIAFVCLIRRGK